MRRFIEWDSLDVRVNGEQISAMAGEMVANDPMIDRLELRFTNGLLRVEGAVRKFILIPFTVDITHFDAKGTTVRVPLGRITAGSIPIPSLLVALLRRQFPADIGFEPPSTLVLSLDRAVSLENVTRHPVLADLARLLDDGAERGPVEVAA